MAGSLGKRSGFQCGWTVLFLRVGLYPLLPLSSLNEDNGWKVIPWKLLYNRTLNRENPGACWTMPEKSEGHSSGLHSQNGYCYVKPRPWIAWTGCYGSQRHWYGHRHWCTDAGHGCTNDGHIPRSKVWTGSFRQWSLLHQEPPAPLPPSEGLQMTRWRRKNPPNRYFPRLYKVCSFCLRSYIPFRALVRIRTDMLVSTDGCLVNLWIWEPGLLGRHAGKRNPLYHIDGSFHGPDGIRKSTHQQWWGELVTTGYKQIKDCKPLSQGNVRTVENGISGNIKCPPRSGTLVSAELFHRIRLGITERRAHFTVIQLPDDKIKALLIGIKGAVEIICIKTGYMSVKFLHPFQLNECTNKIGLFRKLPRENKNRI